MSELLPEKFDGESVFPNKKEEVSRFMTLAIAKAEESLKDGEIPVGAIFVCDSDAAHLGTVAEPSAGSDFGKVVMAATSNKTNASKNGTRHAEMVAIDQIILDKKYNPSIFRKMDLYVTCEPCIMCAAALSRVGIRRVYFGCHNDRFGGNGSILSVHKDTIGSHYAPYPAYSGIMKDEAIAVFQRFYSRENKQCPETKRRRKDDSA